MFANDSEDMRSPGKGIDPRAMINDLSNEPIIYAEQRIQLVNETMLELPSKLRWKSYFLGRIQECSSDITQRDSKIS